MGNISKLLKPGLYEAECIESARTDNGSWEVKDKSDATGEKKTRKEGQPRVLFIFEPTFKDIDVIASESRTQSPRFAVFSVKGKPVEVKKGQSLNFAANDEQEMPWSDFANLYKSMEWSKIAGTKEMGHSCKNKVLLKVGFQPADRFAARNFIESISKPKADCTDLDAAPNSDI